MRRPGVPQVFDLTLAVPTPEACCTKSLVARQDGEVFDLISARAAAVGAVVADQRAVAEEQEVRVRVEKGVAGIAAETVEMPSVSG
jgi:hypothetical protein